MRKPWFNLLYVCYKTLDWLRGKILSAMIRATATKFQ